MTPLDPRVTQGGLALAALLAALLGWQYGYEASVRAHRADVAQAVALREDVNRLDTMVQAAGGPVSWLVRAQQRIAALQERFPAQAQLPTLLDELVATLRAGTIELVDVAQGTTEPVQADGQPLLIDGRPCLQLPVTLSAEGRYHELLDALARLIEPSFPALVSLEQIALRAKDAEGPTVVATVQLHIYVLAAGPALPRDGS